MRSRSILFFACVFLPLAGQAEPVADLLTALWEESFVQHLNVEASLATDFDEVWQRTAEGHLRVTGKGLGYLRSKETFENYHLVVEYRWTEPTYASRADRARDGGVLFHISGSDGAFGGTWPACLQAQLIEGGSGDLVCLPTEETPTGFQSNASLQDLPIWTIDADLHSFPLTGKKTGHLGWKDRSENWSDTKGFRGELDVENSVGEWNRLEVIAIDDTVEIRLNGEVVNQASGVFPTKGSIGFQTEFASYEIRRADLFGPGTFEESWTVPPISPDKEPNSAE
ncbi:MAG: DUF1080 domain-containing protein [Verrucomicrobiota bacterium]